MDDVKVTQFEDRTYLDPSNVVTQTDEFVKNLREVEAANRAQVYNDTHALGTQVANPSMGGLGAGIGYFQERYAPYTNATAANLLATARANALTQAMNNYGDQMQKRVNDAYHRYQRAASAAAKAQSIADKGKVTAQEMKEGTIRDALQTVPDNAYGERNTTTISTGTDGKGNPTYRVVDTDTGEILEEYTGEATTNIYAGKTRAEANADSAANAAAVAGSAYLAGNEAPSLASFLPTYLLGRWINQNFMGGN